MGDSARQNVALKSPAPTSPTVSSCSTSCRWFWPPQHSTDPGWCGSPAVHMPPGSAESICRSARPGTLHQGMEWPGQSWWKSETPRSTPEAQRGVATPLSGRAGHPWWQAQWHSVDSSPLCEMLPPCQTPLAPLLC